MAAFTLPVAAAAADSLVPELERRLAADGVGKVNAYLGGHWTTAMLPLNRQTANCEPGAVRLAVRLSRTTDARAARAHVESIREAVGTCTAFVLALATREEVPRYCASVPSWTVMQTVRELRRRIGAIDSDESLRSTPGGKSCRAAYLYELENTRVVLKSTPPPSRHSE
ncbi:MAG TPA: hypothetical protein VMG60_11125 [Burkholderiaceae bacterium]|nr:hypothetical protein [Burkholderiaceae bacterium]